jgi:hypothetical protein
MPHNYEKLAIVLILAYATIYLGFLTVMKPGFLITHDTYNHADMVQNGSEIYPPLFFTIIQIEMAAIGSTNYEAAVFLTFLTGSLLALIVLPYFVFKMFEEYKKSSKIAFMGLFVYLFGTSITNSLYYANVWANVLAMIFLVVGITFIMKKEWLAAILLFALTFLTHKEICWYAMLVFVAAVIINKKQENGIASAGAYCVSKAGEISYSLSCYLPMVLIVYPFFWLVTLKNAMWKTVNDKVYIIASVLPLFFAFVDLRIFLATFTFWSLYIGEEMLKGRKRMALILLICAAFSIFSFFYTLDLARTAIS